MTLVNPRLILNPEPRLEALLETIQRVEAFAQSNQVSRSNTYALTVAVEELLTNTIMFGFEGVSEPDLAVSLEGRGEKIVCEISDNGAGFDPRSANSDSNQSHARSRAFPSELIQEVAPSLEWRRDQGRNTVRLEYEFDDPSLEQTSR